MYGCKEIIHGAVGIAKVAANSLGAGIDEASDLTKLNRRDICRVCEYATRNESRMDRPTKGLTALSRCIKCECNIKAKTSLASEKCPENKW